MTYSALGIGAAADDGTGDTLRVGGAKINGNFVELYTLLGTGSALSSGISATGSVVTLTSPVIATSINHADNVKAYYGTGNDLQIYHDGTNSYIKDAGTGNLTIIGNQVNFVNAAGNETLMQVNQDSDVQLFYDNVKKLATASAGIAVTGTIASSGNIELGTSATLIFEGATADAYETTFTVTDPTADRTITLPNITGTLITTGDTGTVTSTMIADGAIVAADIATGAVTTTEILDGTIATIDIADGAINSAKILDGTIVTADIADNAITIIKMADDSVGSNELLTLSTLLIKNSAGSTLKTCHCAGA